VEQVSGRQKNILKDCYFISKCFKRRNSLPGKKSRFESKFSWGVTTLLCCFD